MIKTNVVMSQTDLYEHKVVHLTGKLEYKLF